MTTPATRTTIPSMKWGTIAALAILAGGAGCAGCVGNITGPDDNDDPGGDNPGDPDDPGNPGDPPGDPIDTAFQVRLVPQSGVSGEQVVNFALPVPAGVLDGDADVRVGVGGTEVASARRVLARWPDGSVRSVQIQVTLDVDGEQLLDVEVGTAGATGASLVPVESTLVTADGTSGPRVWAVIPSEWLAASGVVGPVVAASAIEGTELDAFDGVCDYSRWNTDAFLSIDGEQGSWLFDRATALYRGYAITGGDDVLASAYREAAIYRAGISGTGSSTRIGVPASADDLKYHYTQGMAIHYLLTGDDRFREAAENVAIRAHDLWSDPGYDGGADFWTERHAGFGLLAYEWAAQVSDDRAATFAAWSDDAVDAYLAMQQANNAWEADARCFAHSADAHGEDYGYVGCSPWMSAIVADAIDGYARRVGGSRADAARAGLASLGRMIARHGRDDEGRPYYWMGAGVDAAEADAYDEHWGESAYVVAMAWHWAGRDEAELRTAAMELLSGLRTRGEAGQLRSFNWQCRSAVMAPAFLRE